MRTVPATFEICFWAEKLIRWLLICHSDIQSQCDTPTTHARQAQKAMLNLGVKPRMYDNPNRQSDRDKFKHLDLDKMEFSVNGAARHTVHNIKEICCTYML